MQRMVIPFYYSPVFRGCTIAAALLVRPLTKPWSTSDTPQHIEHGTDHAEDRHADDGAGADPRPALNCANHGRD